MEAEVRLCLEKQAGMLYKVCLVSPHTSHLVKWDGNYNKLWKCEKNCDHLCLLWQISCLSLALLLFYVFLPTLIISRLSKSLSHPHPLYFFSPDSIHKDDSEWKCFHIQHTVAAIGKLCQRKRDQAWSSSQHGYLFWTVSMRLHASLIILIINCAWCKLQMKRQTLTWLY